MPRTDATQVGAIIVVDDGDVLDPFINAANELVTEACVPSGYDDTRLAMIETWLAAHFYAILKPRKTSVAPTGLSVGYQSAVQIGFNVTHYGQQALRLDTKGGLAAIEAKTKKGKGKLAVFWLGTDDDELDPDERGWLGGW